MARGQTAIDCSRWLHSLGDPVNHVRIPLARDAPVLLFDAVLWLKFYHVFVVFIPFVYKICLDTSRVFIIIVLMYYYSLPYLCVDTDINEELNQ